LADEIEFLAVPKRLSQLGNVLIAEYQQFRAGIEGTISCLKRAYRLSQCYFRGFKGFCQAVGSAIFCHNLTVMTAKQKKNKTNLNKFQIFIKKNNPGEKSTHLRPLRPQINVTKKSFK
jgi:hypothetical protein